MAGPSIALLAPPATLLRRAWGAQHGLEGFAKGCDGYEGYQKQVQGILTVGEEGEIVIEPKMKEWLESIECTAEGDA